MRLLTTIEQILSKFPTISKPILAVYRKYSQSRFRSSEEYWIDRYKKGGNSGDGSYGQLAMFKAEIVNGFVARNSIKNIIEYGCGDGNQLKLAKYPEYIGFDISLDAIKLCRALFEEDRTKSFYLIKEYNGQLADLTLSLDVIYHLVEDDKFQEYMRLLFNSAKKYTIIYSTNSTENYEQGSHIKHRSFTKWVEANFPNWELISHIENIFSSVEPGKGVSGADFFIFQKKDNF